jgi:hypothetical protein
VGKKKAADVCGMKPKKKCCRSSTRCMRCPVVIHKMQKFADQGMSDKELNKALKKVRARAA